MVEICACDGPEVRFEGDIAPYRTPEAGAIYRNDCDVAAFLAEDIDRELDLVGLALLHVVVLGLEVVGELDRVDGEIPDLLAVEIYRICLLDVFLILDEHVFVADFHKLVHRTVLGGCEHLADGLRLDVCVLLRLESHRHCRKYGRNQDYDHSRINDRICISVSVHIRND